MSWRRMRSEAQAARADAPNGFSLSKRRAAINKGLLGTSEMLRRKIPQWVKEYAYLQGRHAAEMTMNVYTKPAVIHIPLDQLVTKTWTEGRRHYTEIRDREGHLVKREYKDFQ